MSKILAIDDKQDNLIVISALLKNLIPDCAVITAKSGKEGIEKAKKHDPDAVLLDIIMPEMNGYEVCRYLKADDRTKHIPVIMLTAIETDTSSRIKGLENGADAFMAKPIDETELVAQVKVALRIKKAEDQLRKEKDLLEDMVQERTKALVSSEKRFRSLVENSLIGISIIQDEKVVYQNPEQKRIAGPLSESFEIQNFDSVHPDDQEKVATFYQDMMRGENVITDLHFRFYPQESQSNNGNIKWVQCRANSVIYKNKPAILLCMIDITRTKELERLLNIEDKMSSLGRVAAGIAHEIRNPLSSINIYLSILQKLYNTIDNLGSESIEMINDSIEKMASASQKIESVVKRVLDFSRPNEPKLNLIDINRCVKNTIDFADATLRNQDVSVEAIFQESLPQCYMETQSVSQVILNLITNAAEAMKKIQGHKIITIRTFQESNDIVVTVSDCGHGIPIDIRDKIFDPFYSTKSNGSGIGLSISHRIIQDHGGELSVADSKSSGAKFIIKLPINEG